MTLTNVLEVVTAVMIFRAVGSALTNIVRLVRASAAKRGAGAWRLVYIWLSTSHVAVHDL